MRRREFIAALGGAVAWPLAARAQQAAMMPVIGFLSSRAPETDTLVLRAFRRGLAAQGYVEGRNVAVEYRWANGDDSRFPSLAADLMRRSPAVIVAVGSGEVGTRAIRAINSTIPIVFDAGSDPIRSGLVPNLNRPGGNTTGIVGLLPELTSKRMALLHELLPRASTIAFLINPHSGWSGPEVVDVQGAARQLGLQIRLVEATDQHELDAAFASFSQTRPDALLLAAHPLFFVRAEHIVAAAAHLSIPTVYVRREFAAVGGLMSYGTNTEEYNRVLGEYAGRILKGEKPGDLPVQQPTKFELVINLKTAKTLGLEIPPGLLAIADEVIE
jgi:putative ABC transport system substrate-binding protein